MVLGLSVGHRLPALAWAAWLAVAATGLQAQQPDQDWSLVLQQGDRTATAPAEARLAREPFKLQFSGTSGWGYAVLAATSCTVLQGLKTAPQVAALIRPTAIAAESSNAADNTDLAVNLPVNLTVELSTAHAWAEDKDNDVHSFQDLKPGPNGQLTATRTIDRVALLGPGDKRQELPVARYPQAELCLLATGLPPVGTMAHVKPKLLRIRF